MTFKIYDDDIWSISISPGLPERPPRTGRAPKTRKDASWASFESLLQEQPFGKAFSSTRNPDIWPRAGYELTIGSKALQTTATNTQESSETGDRGSDLHQVNWQVDMRTFRRNYRISNPWILAGKRKGLQLTCGHHVKREQSMHRALLHSSPTSAFG